ncbi:MAG: hypothetical protein K0Q49_711 [Haloplasmataceae bacterium]|jgi:hypothetical protein|nr:hypothetical protein [Haloplasmataceae bacterium]
MMQKETDNLLSDDVKLKLGCLIREIRKYKYQEYVKDDNNFNPYTKENICSDICHINTLSKLECEVVKKDSIYHSILAKLDLKYNVNDIEFIENSKLLENVISGNLLHAIEFKDNVALEAIKNKLDTFNFENDCFNKMNLWFINFFIVFKLYDVIEEKNINLLTGLLDYFIDIYKCLAKNLLGLYFFTKKNYDTAKTFLLEARESYIKLNINPGIINDDLIKAYEYNNNYLEAIQLCLEMEKYYFINNNYNCLINVYIFLDNYYLLINANEQALCYFNKTTDLVLKNPDLNHNVYLMNYNWALKHYKNNEIDQAIDYGYSAYKNCNVTVKKLETINLLLILYTKVKNNKILKLIEEGKKYLDYANDYDQLLFRYFVYKFENKDYYRKFATEKVMPFLKKIRNKKEFLLFIYEDLYEI